MTVETEFATYSVMLTGAGLYLFYSGFQDLKAKRIIENIPTSKIDTGAVGSNVEIKGVIDSKVQPSVQAPVSGQDCLFFSIEIQEEVRSKDHTYWKTLDQFYSHDGFYLNDGSGARALVYVQGAEIKRERFNKEFLTRSNRLDQLPQTLVNALTEHRDKLKRFKWKNSSWLFSNRIRFLEWCFYSGEQLYVLGCAQSGLKIEKKKKLKFKHFLSAKNQIEQDDSLRDRFDDDKDGTLDAEELERGAKILGYYQQTRLEKKEECLEPVVKMVFRNNSSHLYIISNMKEKNLVKSMNFESVFKLFGGPVMALAGIYFLASNL
jgi:hypothetical protein